MRVVITGGTWAGKTSLVKALSEQGFRTVPEAGRIVVRRLNQEMGVRQQVEWRAQNPERLMGMICSEQERLESDLGEGPAFLDRGMHDYLGFLRLAGREPSREVIRRVGRARYGLAFLCETLSGFDPREESGRSLKREGSVRLRDLIEGIYRDHGMRLVRLPEAPLEERLRLVREELGI